MLSVVRLVRQHFTQPGVIVTESKELRNAVLGINHDVDIVIEGQIDGEPMVVSVEVIEHGRPATLAWVELWLMAPTVKRVAEQLGYGVESVRLWVRQADIDDGHEPGVSTAEATAAHIKARAGLRQRRWWMRTATPELRPPVV